MKVYSLLLMLAVVGGCSSSFFDPSKVSKDISEMTREEIVELTMKPFSGESNPGVDTSTVKGKVVCGYQGWFTTPDDGANMGWFHWGGPSTPPSVDFEPGDCTIDMWPDMSEYPEEAKVATPFKHADGSVAHVYSNMNPLVQDLHFQWMKEYGIDAAFVQRFAVQTIKLNELYNVNVNLTNCRAAANKHGRGYVVMYDLTGLNEKKIPYFYEDIKNLVNEMKIGHDKNDKAYMHHNGKPLIVLWGVGFRDGRQYSLKECEEFIDFLRDDPQYGGFSIMLGVPTYWRDFGNDTIKDPDFHRVLKKADIISPWVVGRYGTLQDIEHSYKPRIAKDIEWSKENSIDFLPICFPGFSWYNLYKRDYNKIPRLKGDFIWSQFYASKVSGAEMIYVAMFDEVDEGTAINKVTNDPPVGDSKFLTYEGLPSDHYLWLTGQAGKMLRDEIPVTKQQPKR